MREFHPSDAAHLERLPDSQTDCMRCKILMKEAGNLTLHHGRPLGVLGNAAELVVGRSGFEMLICPRCGKVELYV